MTSRQGTEEMNAMKLRLILIGIIISLIGIARVAIGGSGDPFAVLLPLGIVVLALGLVWRPYSI